MQQRIEYPSHGHGWLCQLMVRWNRTATDFGEVLYNLYTSCTLLMEHPICILLHLSG